MERPWERRASVRTAVVWEAVRDLLDRSPGQTVVDIGGGTGGFAVRVAEAGHQVTVVDPNPDALAALARRADERGVSGLVRAQQGDLASLAEYVPDGSGDLVLCHEVLGLVDDHLAALAAIRGVLRPGGTLSLLVSQRHAAVIARAMAGHFVQAREALDGATGSETRFTADQMQGLLVTAGFTVADLQAVRVFADLVPSTLLDLEPGAVDGLLDLERAVATRSEYFTIAAQLHFVATA